MSVVYIVTENAGYDVGTIVCGAFSTRSKAEDWVKAKCADQSSWNASAYDVEEYQLDPLSAGQVRPDEETL
jgi:hypothetical protein